MLYFINNQIIDKRDIWRSLSNFSFFLENGWMHREWVLFLIFIQRLLWNFKINKLKKEIYLERRFSESHKNQCAIVICHINTDICRETIPFHQKSIIYVFYSTVSMRIWYQIHFSTQNKFCFTRRTRSIQDFIFSLEVLSVLFAYVSIQS